MSNTIEQLQVLYEIAMSIGLSLDLRSMLKNSLAVLLKKLSCSAGGVLLFQPHPISSPALHDVQEIHFEEVFTIPRSITHNKAYQAAIRHVPKTIPADRLGVFFQQLPLSGQEDPGSFFYILELPDIGLLILTKYGEGLDPIILKSLKPLSNKLASACKACLQNTALRESEENYRSIFENVQDVYLETRIDGTIIEVSPSIEFISKGQYKKVDLIGKSMYELYTDTKDRDALLETMQKTGSVTDFEVSLKNRDASIIFCSISAKMLLNSERRPEKIIGSIHDITDRKQAEDALRESTDYLENLLSFANAPIMVWDNNNKVTKFNLAFERMTGYTMYDVLGKNPEILFSDDKRIEISTLISRTSDGENLISVELPVRCKNGIIRNVLWNTSNIYTKDAKTIIATIANGQDVTERKRAEEDNRKLSSAVEQSNSSIIITDLKGEIEYVNPKFIEMTGYSAQEAIGKSPWVLKPGHISNDEYKNVRDTIIKGEVWRGEFQNKKKNGELYWELTTISPIKDSNGTITHYVAIDEDITQEKAITEQMRQMQKLEGLGTLAGGIAHDFNNILGIILAYITSTIRFKDDAEKLDLAVDTIVKAVERGKTLVQQILTFARKTETEFGPVKVNDVVLEIMTMIFETFPKILTYAQNIDQGVSYINADRSQLHQLLLNLCVNARDAMPNGGLLTINTQMVSGASLLRQHPDAVESSYVCIEVSDTGEGMTPETSKRIFEPFFTTKELGKGTGLGLAVVFGVVQTHKGFIDVESELEKGTTFSIYLPASQVAEPIIVKKDEATLEETPGGTETLLVVEDEEMLMMTLQMLLVEKGYTVLSASDGLTAVNIYKERKNEIALVLTDLGLPKMTGMEECVQIKKLDPSARVIVATGYLDSGMKSEFLKTGIQHFLFKPYDLKQVLKMVREVIDEK
jgi:PAS domain S-box-containing protein